MKKDIAMAKAQLNSDACGSGVATEIESKGTVEINEIDCSKWNNILILPFLSLSLFLCRVLPHCGGTMTALSDVDLCSAEKSYSNGR